MLDFRNRPGIDGKIARGTPIADPALPMPHFRNRPGVYGQIVRGTPIAVI